MRVLIYHTSYYEWQKVPPNVKVTEEDFKALRAKVLHDNSVAMRVELPAPFCKVCDQHLDNHDDSDHDHDGETYTDQGIPEPVIEYHSAASSAKGKPMSRAQIAAFVIQEHAVVHCAHPDHFTKILVEGEPDTENFLNVFFNTAQVRKPAPAAPTTPPASSTGGGK